MSFPPSVNHLVLPRTKGRNNIIHNNQKEFSEDNQFQDDIEEQERDQVDDAVGVGGPTVEFGRQGGVCLQRKRGAWGWLWSVEDRQADLKWRAGKEAIHFFPASQTPEIEPDPELSLKEVINSSVQYAEDLCLPYERDGLRDVITDILMEEHAVGPSGTSKQAAGPLPKTEGAFDETQIYQGSIAAVIQNRRGKCARTFVAFPTGEVGHHLNDATALLVRTRTATHLLNLHPSSTPFSAYVTSTRISELSFSDTECRRHVDVVLDPATWSRALVVDEGGGVWMWWEEKEIRRGRLEKVMNLRKIRDKITDDRDQFFRISFGTQPGTALILSSREATLIDVDSLDHPTTSLITLSGFTRRFTFLEKTALERGSRYTTMCTTHEVFWLDESGKGSPALGFKHEYGVANMEAIVFPGQGRDQMTTLLYSPSHPFITALTTPKTDPIRFLTPPYALSLPLHQDITVKEFSYLSLNSNRHPPSLLILDQEGGLWCMPLISSRDAHFAAVASAGGKEDQKRRQEIGPISAQWDDEVSSLAAKERDREGLGVGEGWREKIQVAYKEIDLRWVWLAINQQDIKIFSSEHSVSSLSDIGEREEEGESAELMTRNDWVTDDERESGEQAVDKERVGEDVGNEEEIDAEARLEETDHEGRDKEKRGEIESHEAATNAADIATEEAEKDDDEWDEGDWEDEEGEGEEGLEGKQLQGQETESWFKPEEFSQYLRELEAPMDGLVTGSELALDMCFPSTSFLGEENVRKWDDAEEDAVLQTLIIHPYAIRSTLEGMDELDLSKLVPISHTLHSKFPSFTESRPSLHLPYQKPSQLYGSLLESFPPSSLRDNLFAAQLTLNLHLSACIVSPSDYLPLTRAAHDRLIDAAVEEEQRGDEVELFVQATSQLSLNDRTPPLIEFSVVKPKLAPLKSRCKSLNTVESESEWEDIHENDEKKKEEKRMERLQTHIARTLNDDWKLGQDPTYWTWTPMGLEGTQWNPDHAIDPTQGDAQQPMGGMTGTQKESDRRIRPLPSSRSYPSLSLSQPRSRMQPPSPPHTSQFHSFSHLIPPSLSTSRSVPSIPSLAQGPRSSPPPTMSQMGIVTSSQPEGESQDQEIGWASTQVERGKFGGKLEKKKKNKKRLGGF
ncbi:hypothetical protein I305_06662 [Cryptococcus gattii E566]|nr:hypothetical protein I305_06662 [Cryptococcus gattii E566]